MIDWLVLYMNNRKNYLNFLPVYSEKMADLLKSDINWKILKKIRSSGLNGITARKMSEILNESPSTIHNSIRELKRMGFITGIKERHMKANRLAIPEEIAKGIRGEFGGKLPRRMSGRSPTYYVSACDKRSGITHRRAHEAEDPWGDIVFHEDFRKVMLKMIKESEQDKKLFKHFENYIIEVYEKLLPTKRSETVKEILPTEKILCPRCNKNHEKYEFIKAMLFLITTMYMDSKEFEDLSKKLKIRKK